MYLQAAGGSGYLQITVEIDRATMAAPEWANGAAVRVEVGPADMTAAERQVETGTLEAGKRVYALRQPARDLLAPGRYQVRAQVTAQGARVPLTLSARDVCSSRPPMRVSVAPNAWWSRRRSLPQTSR